jgi:hypothetical protein
MQKIVRRSILNHARLPHFHFSALLLLLVFTLLNATAEELFFDFSKDKLNEQPAGFLSTVSGEGKPGKWVIIEDEVPSSIPNLTANASVPKKPVLAQLSRDLTDEHYPILVYTNEVFGDFTFTTRFKNVGGVVEQMAGIVFRYQDEKNYYYLRASSKGSTFRFFKIVGGQRSAPIGPEMKIPAGEWHELAVEAKGNTLKFLLNGKQLIPTATDYSFSSGRIGFWTKSDSVSYFTDGHVTFTPRETLAHVLVKQMKEQYPRVLGLRIYGSTPEKPKLQVMAATDESTIGTLGGDAEQSVIDKNIPYAGKFSEGIMVTLPLHDRNGDTIAALRVEMKSFPGQTDRNALARALPIAREMEKRMTGARELF